MSTWKLSTAEKKSCTQIEFWKKGDLVAQREIGWRWCWARYKIKPDLSDYDPNKHQIELYGLGDIEDMEQDDGCWESWDWPEDVDEEEAERLAEIYEEEGEDGLENEGWSIDDTEYWVSGQLDLEQEIQWYLDGGNPMVVVNCWTKDDQIVEHRVTYESTHAEFDEQPDISGYDPEDQIDLADLEMPVRNYQTAEKISDVWEFPEDMSTKEKNWFKKREWVKWAKAGWQTQDAQIWVTGELTVIKDEEE